MSSRIRELEDALAEVHTSHPLLREDLLLIKKSADLFGVDPSQTQPSAAGGSKRTDTLQQGFIAPASPSALSDVRYVATARYNMLTPVSQRQSQSPPANGSSDDYGLPPDIVRISEGFPAPSALTSEMNPSLRKRILELLPPQHEARYLCEQAAEHAAWQCVSGLFHPLSPTTATGRLPSTCFAVTYRTLTKRFVRSENSDGSDGVPNMVHSVYNTSSATLNPHRLSYFLIVLAIGVCVDQRRSHHTWWHDAERYHILARAAMCETSPIIEPSLDAINGLVRTKASVVVTPVLTTPTVLHGSIFANVLGGEGGIGICMGDPGESREVHVHYRMFDAMTIGPRSQACCLRTSLSLPAMVAHELIIYDRLV